MTIYSYKKIPVLYILGALRMSVSAATSLYKTVLQHRDVEDCHTYLLFLCFFFQTPQVLYAPPTTASSCLSARRPATYHETTQSPTAPHSTLLLPDDTSRSHRPSIKHVQFPDDAAHSSQTSEGSLSPTF